MDFPMIPGKPCRNDTKRGVFWPVNAPYNTWGYQQEGDDADTKKKSAEESAEAAVL